MRWKWIWKIGMDMDRGGCWGADLPEGWGVALAIFHLGWCQGGLNLVACLDGINDHAWLNCLPDNQFQPPFHQQQRHSCQFHVRILRLFSPLQHRLPSNAYARQETIGHVLESQSISTALYISTLNHIIDKSQPTTELRSECLTRDLLRPQIKPTTMMRR